VEHWTVNKLVAALAAIMLAIVFLAPPAEARCWWNGDRWRCTHHVRHVRHWYPYYRPYYAYPYYPYPYAYYYRPYYYACLWPFCW
jgi:hypothetical protein